jgi:hypothetical protein
MALQIGLLRRVIELRLGTREMCQADLSPPCRTSVLMAMETWCALDGICRAGRTQIGRCRCLQPAIESIEGLGSLKSR